MPGDNCSIFGCGTCRRTKGVGIFKIPQSRPDKPEHEVWRTNWLNAVTRSRIVNVSFKAQIKKDSVFVCEKHFDPSDIELVEGPKMTKKIMKPGALPKLNMPKKSHDNTIPTVVRRTVVHKKLPSAQSSVNYCYKSLEEVKKRVATLKTLSDWELIIKENEIQLIFNNKDLCVIPKYKLIIDESLTYYVAVYGWCLPDTHPLYYLHKRSLRNITISNLIITLCKFSLCNGHGIIDDNSKVIFHNIPLKNDIISWDGGNKKPYESQNYYRVVDCNVILDSDTICKPCKKFKNNHTYNFNAKNKRNLQPAKLNAPISVTSPDRLKITIQQHRLKCNQFEKEIEKMQEALKKSSVNIDSELSRDFTNIMSDVDKEKVSPFMNLFWQQQKKLFTANANGVRYHPMLIRFCLSLACKSSSTYNELRDSGVLTLPSLRTLRDYKNCIKPQTGFHPDIINELISQTKNYTNIEKNIVILMDEMTIKANLVYDRNSHELIGFTDLGDPDVNYCTLDDTEGIATHALVFMVRGLCTKLKFSLAYFGTINVTSIQLFILFWDAVCILETKCKLFVIAVTADGASSNRSMFRMHFMLDPNRDKPVVYRTINLYCKHRFIYFISDAPHLIKTVRNCLFHSGYGRCTRYMWNNNKYLIWEHIKQAYQDDAENPLKLLPKLTQEHVNLTSFSLMTVRYAVQVLSKTMSVVLRAFGDENENSETAMFCEKMDDFFDIMNIRNLDEGQRKNKDNLKPFTNINDPRFVWLIENFLKYFDEWKVAIENRPGNFTKNAKSRMFISWQSFEGLQMTVYSIIEVTRYLLQNGFRYVMTNRFCQDPVEEFFGCQRKMGGNCDNPDLKNFGYGNNAIRIQRYVSCSSGNTRGAYEKKKSWINVTGDLVPKRKKKKK